MGPEKCRVLHIFYCKMTLAIYSKEQIRSQRHIQRFLGFIHCKVKSCNSTETHWNSSNNNIFLMYLLFYANLTVLLF